MDTVYCNLLTGTEKILAHSGTQTHNLEIRSQNL